MRLQRSPQDRRSFRRLLVPVHVHDLRVLIVVLLAMVVRDLRLLGLLAMVVRDLRLLRLLRRGDLLRSRTRRRG